jgi:hypothetical protein
MTPRITKIADLILSKDKPERKLGIQLFTQWHCTYGHPTLSEFEVGKRYMVATQVCGEKSGWFLQEWELTVTSISGPGEGILRFEDKRFDDGGSIGVHMIFAWTKV